LDSVDKVREEALKIIIKIFDDKSYSNILLKNLKQKYSPLDRAFITEIVYGTVKWKLKIDYIINSLSKIKVEKISASILNILRMGIYQIGFMDKVPQPAAVNECVKLAKKYGNAGAAKYVNAVLRNYCRNMECINFPERDSDAVKYMSVMYSYPEWIVKTLIDEFGKEFTEEYLIASNAIPPLTVRVNNLKIDKNILKEILSQKGIEVFEGAYIDDALVLKGVSGIENLEEYKKGYLTVQDESSMIAALVLDPKPGEFIMDVCSAPGTKATYFGELMNNKGRIISGDINESKLKLVRDNCSRLGITIVETLKNDASKTMPEFLGKADKVLVDAPCSGLGIMRKKPEIRWNRGIMDLKAIQAIQLSIINASSKYVKTGGVLVYSTCTILKNENLGIVNNFISNNKDFVLEDISHFIPDKLKKESSEKGYIELYPHIDGIDGFFIARLRKVK